jgi:hypothetical protein
VVYAPILVVFVSLAQPFRAGVGMALGKDWAFRPSAAPAAHAGGAKAPKGRG